MHIYTQREAEQILINDCNISESQARLVIILNANSQGININQIPDFLLDEIKLFIY